MQLAKTQS